MSEPAELSLEELNRRLAEIDASLDGDVRDPSAQQYAILRERDALRAQAAKYWASRDSSRSTSALQDELKELVRRRKSEVSSRTGYVTAKGGNNHGPSSGAWVKLAAQSWAASDMARLNSRIGAIESELERRSSSGNA